MNTPSIAVVGAGLAGCEAAWALARAGISVTLFEMRPGDSSPAHKSADLAELVCSNSFRSDEITSGVGLLKQELRDLGSLCMTVAEECRVPAGKALAVDRELFSRRVTERIEAEPRIRLIRKRVDDARAKFAEFDRVIVAAGPMAHERLSAGLAEILGAEHLYFYDAIAPIVAAEGIDRGIVFQGSRYGDGEGDYLNCPMNEEEYRAFVAALLAAEKVRAHAFEQERHFEGCMPIEALAERGEQTLAFGPFKPVGFRDPRTGQRPYAIVQLRAENAERSAFNLVGCQTKLTYAEQNRVFRLIPGLEQVEFLRFGSMHRNTFVNAPNVLAADLSLRAEPRLHLAGQITGVEGYVESAACGLWAGLVLAEKSHGRELPAPPTTTALGALLGHLRTPAKNFQPSNCNFGLMPEPEERPKKKARKAVFAQRARADFALWLAGVLPHMQSPPVPVLVSACLAGHACRYDGTASPHPAALRWVAQDRALPVCPETLGGLPVPREACELRDENAVDRNGVDHTAAFLDGCEKSLKMARESGCRLAVLKARSPSCGKGEIYDGSFSRHLIKGDGLFARALLAAEMLVLSDEDLN